MSILLGILLFEIFMATSPPQHFAFHGRPVQVRQSQLESFVVTAEQMQAIESRLFASGMPVAALMEKVGGLITQCFQSLYPCEKFPKVGVLVGPGHNGGDALVVARELCFQGYRVAICRPFTNVKPLNRDHFQYLQSLEVPVVEDYCKLLEADVIVDGLFGFGLEREIEGEHKRCIESINTGTQPVVSIDIPSGLHTDTGDVLGAAIEATYTLCLGLWKIGLFQDHALHYLGQSKLIDFDIPVADIEAILHEFGGPLRITNQFALSHLPLQRPADAHKYSQGHVLLVGGSQRYPGSILLAAKGARATGIGMLSIAVPQSLKDLVVAQIPEALVIGCLESEHGAIAHLPSGLSLERFDTIAFGPGVTTENSTVLQQLLASDVPLILDADGLSLLAQAGLKGYIRQAPLVLTPHPGEFKRLFPDLSQAQLTKLEMARKAAERTGAIVLLKGARTVIAIPDIDIEAEASRLDSSSIRLFINPESTPALARGGSGDVLTGLIGGLYAQTLQPEVVVSAAWWHAQAGRFTARNATLMGVDPVTLSEQLLPTLKASLLA